MMKDREAVLLEVLEEMADLIESAEECGKKTISVQYLKEWAKQLRCKHDCEPPNTQVRGELSILKSLARDVLSHREGELPRRGWLRDNDKSRKALDNLAQALVPNTLAESRPSRGDKHER